MEPEEHYPTFRRVADTLRREGALDPSWPPVKIGLEAQMRAPEDELDEMGPRVLTSCARRWREEQS